MQSEALLNNIEIGVNKFSLPEQLEGVQNKDVFLDVYKNIKSWYGNNFSDGDIKLIRDSRKSTCAEYKGVFDPTRRAIAANRIDSALFRAHYPKFFNLDKKYIMGTIPNTLTQRKFREIVINLEKKFGELNFGELYNSDVEKIEERLQKEIEKQPRSNSQVFDTIYKELVNIISENHVYNDSTDLGDMRLNRPSRLPEHEIEAMVNTKISNEFESMKGEVLSGIPFDKLKYFKGNLNVEGDKKENRKEFGEGQSAYVKKYATGIFNDFAKQITDYGDGNIPDSFYSDPRITEIVSEHMRKVVNGEEVSATDLVRDIEEELYNYDEFLGAKVNNIEKESKDVLKKIDPEELEKIVVTDEEKEAIRVHLNSGNSDDLMKDLIEAYKLYKYLQQKNADPKGKGQLTSEQEKIFRKLEDLFSHIKKRVIRDINFKRENVYINNYKHKSINLPHEYTTGNIKDIKPAAIVESNEAIYNYVYGLGDLNRNQGDKKINYSDIPLKKKIALFEKLKKQKQGDPTFLYLNYDLSINKNLVNERGIEIKSVIKNLKKIERMIVKLAIEERMEQADKKEINDINIRKSCMICCFRAISSMFDTVNNNKENFANEFKIDDVDKDIGFDKDTGIISMQGTIGANGNHIKLYYDTRTGELSFDNFLAYDSQNKRYKIGKGNNEREIINVKLPTMKDMESSAKSIDYNSIDSLALNSRQYNRMVGRAMRESIRFECFQGFMGVNMEVNKQFVEQFNERNILKQDIIKSIYKKFYNINDLDGVLNKENQYLSISKGNEPEQFKLIELISNTIDHYDNAGELLTFRQYVNDLDKILSTKEIVEKDELLRYLFADNTNRETDVIDSTKKIMSRENENLLVGNRINIISHKNETQENVGSDQLNYYIFLDLLAENKGQNRIINLAEFGKVLDIMKKINSTGMKILNSKTGILRENYSKKVERGEIADVYNMSKEIAEVTDKTKRELADLGVNAQMNGIG